MKKLLLLTLVIAIPACASVDVMVFANSFYTDWNIIWGEIVGVLEADERFDIVDCVDGSTTTPTVAEFLNYDVVFVGARYSGDPARNFMQPTIAGDRLADAVDQGLSIVMNHFCAYRHDDLVGGLAGRIVTNSYAPFTAQTDSYNQSFTWTTETYESTHPVLDGVGNPPLYDVEHLSLAEANSTATVLIAYGDQDGGGVTYEADGLLLNSNQNIVWLNYPIERTVGNWQGYGWEILKNSLVWLTGQTSIEETTWGQIKASF